MNENMFVCSTDLMSMETAIRSGRDDEVHDLLAQMSQTGAIEQLTRKYGLGRDEPDEDGLFVGTTPILHAARSGKLAVFSAVYRAIHARMNSEQVRCSHSSALRS